MSENDDFSQIDLDPITMVILPELEQCFPVLCSVSTCEVLSDFVQ